MGSSGLGRLGACCLFAAMALGSMLLFVIPLLAGTVIRPLFPRDDSPWPMVNLTFQAASCLGFFVAWGLARVPDRRWGLGVLASTATVAVLSLFVFHPQAWNPLPALLLPFAEAAFALSLAGVLLPYWFGRAHMPAWVDPYFVFAFTNLGGPVAILGYSFVAEPWLTLPQRVIGLGVGVATAGALWAVCDAVLRFTERPAAAGAAGAAGAAPPVTWTRQLRWVALAVMPATLLLAPLPETDFAMPFVAALPAFVYQLSWVVAYARHSGGSASAFAWLVQALAVLSCAVFVVVLSSEGGILSAALALLGAIVPAVVPYRWTWLVQGGTAGAALAAAWLPVEIAPIWRIALHAAAVGSAGWGCHGALVADRPGPERLPQFLFFTGMAASLLAAAAQSLLALAPPPAGYAAAVVLTLLVRLLPRVPDAPPAAAERRPVADAGPDVAAALSSDAVWHRERGVKRE